MNQRSRKTLIGSVTALVVAAGITFWGMHDMGASSSPTSPTSAYLDVNTDCSPGFTQVTFTYSNQEPVDGLTACTDGTKTTISNSSEHSVWYVAQPSFNYWSADQDLQYFESGDIDGATVLFRAGIRADREANALTIEPGTAVIFSAAANAIQLRQDPGEQSAWQVASLLADTVSDKGKDEIQSVLEDAVGADGDAIISCVSAGYTIGKTLADVGLSQSEIQSDLMSGLGIYQGTKECGEKIRAAQQASERAGDHPEISLPKIADEMHHDEDWGSAGLFISKARGLEGDFLRFHE